MTASMNRNLAATLIATAAGLVAWLSGLAQLIWPAHPQICALLITIVVSVVVMQVWPAIAGQKRI